MSFRMIQELERQHIEGRLNEWEARLSRMRLTALTLQGEAKERYRTILRELTVKAVTLRARWQQARSRLYVGVEEWQQVVEALEALERAYEEVRGELEPRHAHPVG